MLITGLIVLNIVLFDNNSNNTILKEKKESDIKFNDNKLNVYLFYGKGCPHCEELSEFIKSIDSEYGKYYDLYTFEVWNDRDNAKLMKKMSDRLVDKIAGLPYLIIGDKAFSGYSSSMNQTIKDTIIEQYNKIDRYDVYRNLKDN
jgi:glutaredoxin